MERLGLWGEGAMFSSFEAFLDTTQKKGLGKLIVLVLLWHLGFLTQTYCVHLA